MTEIECEISTQTFMSADLHYITSVPHHWCRESEQGQNNGDVKEGLMGGRKNKWHFSGGDKHERKRTSDREIEKMGSWCSTRASIRLLSLPSRQTWLHHSVPVCRYDLTHAPEPTPSGISLEQLNTFMQVAPQLCGNLQQSYKLFSSLW